jgi:hypothetical protein
MKRSLAVVFGLFAISTAAPALAYGPNPEPVGAHIHRAALGKLVVQNRSGVAQRLAVNGQPFGLIPPGSSKLIVLATGRHEVTWTSAGRFAITESEFVRISPNERETLRLTAATAALKVRNPYRFAVRLVVDGKRIGTIAPGATLSVSGLAPGRVEVELFRGYQKVEDQMMRLSRGLNTFEPGRVAYTSPSWGPSWDVAFR